MSRFDKFAGLPVPEKFLLLRVWALVFVVRLALWMLPFERLRAMIARAPAGPASFPVERLAWSVDVASVYVPRASCLVRALAGQYLLRRNGYACEVKIGVLKKAKAGLQAHAWLETGGRVLLGASQQQFTELTGWEIQAL